MAESTGVEPAEELPPAVFKTVRRANAKLSEGGTSVTRTHNGVTRYALSGSAPHPAGLVPCTTAPRFELGALILEISRLPVNERCQKLMPLGGFEPPCPEGRLLYRQWGDQLPNNGVTTKIVGLADEGVAEAGVYSIWYLLVKGKNPPQPLGMRPFSQKSRSSELPAQPFTCFRA